MPGNPQGGEDEAKKAQEEQMRRDMMSTVLDTAARERCTSYLLAFCGSQGYRLIIIWIPNRPFNAFALFVHGREVSRIALVSPERSRQIETILLRMAQSGQIRGRVSLKLRAFAHLNLTYVFR